MEKIAYEPAEVITPFKLMTFSNRVEKILFCCNQKKSFERDVLNEFSAP